MTSIINQERYSRQTILPEIGRDGQEKLSCSRVLVVGAGGLGCPVLQYLAGAGVGVIGIIDHDLVSLSNLQRQVLFSSHDIGRPKSIVAKEKIESLNPEIKVQTYFEELTDKNAAKIFSEYDVIVDGTDNFGTKFLINDVAVMLGKPFVFGAIQGFDGQVSVFNFEGGPCYRCLYPAPPKAQIRNCSEAGVIGAVAGIVGTIQAIETIKILVHHKSFSPLSGKIWMVDTRTMETRAIKISRNDECRICSKDSSEVILEYTSPVCSATMVEEVSWSDPIVRNAVLIDVREQDEWDQNHIEEAIHFPLSSIQTNIDKILTLIENRACVLYCQSGIRSKKAAELILQSGGSLVYSLKEGIQHLNNP